MNCKSLQKVNTRFALTACIMLCGIMFPTQILAAPKVEMASQTSFTELIETAKHAGIQEDILLLITQDVLEQRLNKGSASCLLTQLVNADNKGLPVSVLEEKIREGKAKGVSTLRICKAIKGLVEEMQFSKQLLARELDVKPQESDLRMMCEILSQGISRQQVEDFVSTYSNKKTDVMLTGLRLYALLNQSGVSPDQLAEFTTLVMKDDAMLMRWRELPQLFLIVIRSGVTQNIFMNKAIEAVKQGTLPHNFARELSIQPRSLGISEHSSSDN